MARTEAVVLDDGKRRCNWCGDFLDPIDWCPSCATADRPCGRPHRRLRKRSDAAYCDSACRDADRTDLAAIVAGRR